MIPTPFAAASLWLVLVLFLGSAYFAAQETERFVVPFLRWLMPGTPVGQLQAVHMVLHKLAHLTEYAVLGAALVQGDPPRRRPEAAGARDFLIDAFGATAMLIVARGRQSAGAASEALGGPVDAEPAD